MRISPKRCLSGCLGLALLALCACATDTSPSPQPPPPGKAVSFPAGDGTVVDGLFISGRGADALVLCHGRGYKTGAASFANPLRHFESRGLTCLALSFRGYPADATPPRIAGREQHILGAVDFLPARGAKRVFVLGSSMGGFIALRALPALEKKKTFAGLIVISAYDDQALTASRTLKLVITAENDTNYHPHVMRMFAGASEPKSKRVYNTGGHGQSILAKQGGTLLNHILNFVRLDAAADRSEP